MNSKKLLHIFGIGIELMCIGAMALSLKGCGGSGGDAVAFVEQVICVEEIQTDEDTVCIEEQTEIVPILPES